MATSEQIRELIEKLHAQRAELVATFKGMTEEAAEHRPADKDGEDGWTTKEILVHLAWQDAIYRGWIEGVVAKEGAAVTTRPVTILGAVVGAGRGTQPEGDEPAVPHYLERAHAFPLIELIRELERQRARTMTLLADLTPDDFDRTVLNPIFGNLTVLQYLRSAYRHERQHRAQILGEQSDYKPRYISGNEPDQRIRR